MRNALFSVKFDSALQQAWTKGGSQGSGFTRGDESILLTNPAGAVFQNIVLPLKKARCTPASRAASTLDLMPADQYSS